MEEEHYVATVSSREPQQIPYAGITSDGVYMTKTDGFDIPMTWIFNMISQNKMVLNYLSPEVSELFRMFKNLNCGDMKKRFYEKDHPKTSIKTQHLSFEMYSDVEVLKKFIPQNFFFVDGKKFDHNYTDDIEFTNIDFRSVSIHK